MSSNPTFATDLSGTKITLGNYYTSKGSYTNIYVFNTPSTPNETYTTTAPILSLANMQSNKPHNENIKYLNITYQLLKILDPFYTLIQPIQPDPNANNFIFDDSFAIQYPEYSPIMDVSGVFNSNLKSKILKMFQYFSTIINSSDYKKNIFKYEDIKVDNATTNTITILHNSSNTDPALYLLDENNYRPVLESYIDFLNQWIARVKSDDKKFDTLEANINKIIEELKKIAPIKKPDDTVAALPTA